MKKRLLSALLALALVFVLLPTTALADSFDPDITIAGTKYDFQLEDYKTNTYAKVYYQHGKFLTKFEYTQDGVWATDPYLELTKTGAGNDTTITITVHKGSNTTKAFEIESAETCIATSSRYWNLVITGSGTLNLTHTGTSAAIWSNHSNITITGGVTVNVKGTKSGSNINSYSNAIQCGETFTVSNGATVVAENNSTYSKGPAVKTEKLIVSGDAKFEAQSAYGGKAISFDSITADGYDFMGRSGNSGSYTTLTGEDKATKLQEYSSIKITPTPTPTLEKSDVSVAGTKLYKNTAYTIQEGKPVMGGTYPDNYNIYLDATNYVLHVKNATIEATYTGIYGVSNIVFEGTNSITAGQYGIISYSKQFDLNISGSGSLTVTTYAGNSAIATDYYTSKSIIISGKDFTVTADTSRTNVSAIYSDKGGLTIKDGAIVKAISANNSKAIRIGGSLTVTDATLTATSTSDKKPTIEVDGSATLAGSKVEITNKSTTQGKSGEYSYEVSTGLYVGGTLDIKNAAKVTSTVIGGNAIYAKGDITISGDSTEVNAQNSAYKFSAISTNKTVNISDNSTVKAENLKRHQGDPTGDTDPSTGKTYNPCPAITGKIANKNSQNKLHIVGFTTSSAGSQNPTEGTPLYLDIAPGSVEPYIHHYKVTITRGDEVARTESPVVIAGTTLLNDTYYTITNNGSTVAEGTKSNYNAFYNSTTKTLKLNNAQISHSFAYENGGGRDGAIIFKEFENYFIELSGENTISSTNTYAINCHRPDRTLTIKNAAEAENAKLTLTSNWMVICSIGGLNIQSDVTMVNTKEAGYLMYVNGTFSFDGYNAYASVNASGSPLVEYTVPTSGDKDAGYQYLRITKENLAPTTPTPQTPFTIYGIPAQFVDGGMIATTGVTATSSNNINLPIDRVEWYTFTPGFRPDGSMDSVINKTKATGNFEAGKYYVVEIRFVQDLSPFESWDMKVSGWSDNDVSRQSVTARNDIEIYFLTRASAATHEHNWAEKYDTVYHWKMCTYDGCTAISGKAPHEWTGWWVDDYRPEVHAQRCNCGYLGSIHSTLKYVAINGEQHQKQCPVDGCDYKIESSTTAHVYAEGSNICTDCGYNKSAPCDHGNRAYTNNGDGTHKVTCKACGATIVEKQSHEFGPTGACIYCGATQSGGDPTPDNPGTIVIIRPAEEEKPAQQPNPSTGANDLVGLAVAAAVAAALGSAALLRKHD